MKEIFQKLILVEDKDNNLTNEWSNESLISLQTTFAFYLYLFFHVMILTL